MLISRGFSGLRPGLYALWVVFFAYSTSAALIFQNVILPMIPSMHAGGGLMFGDAISFHQAAVALANAIAKDGWIAWQPWPQPNSHGNTAVLAALYYFFGPNPAVVVPINAAMHASSGILLILIGRALSPDRIARMASVFAAVLFIVLPSSLNWNGQVHKDGYAILGLFLVFYSGVLIFSFDSISRVKLRVLLSMLFGIAITVFVRPNNILVFLIPAVLMLLASLLYFYQSRVLTCMQIFYFCVILVVAILVRPEAHEAQVTAGSAILSSLDKKDQGLSEFDKWHWDKTTYFPDPLDRAFERAAALRVFMAAYGVREKARSMIDLDVMPQNAIESFVHLPRSLLIGLFAPFPNTWNDNPTLVRLLGVGEIAIFYAIFPGILWFFWISRNKRQAWWVLVSVLGILILESFITSNLGTLHRIRYPLLSIIALFGLMGWAILLRHLFRGKINLQRWSFLGGDQLCLEKVTKNEGQVSNIGRKMLTSGVTVIFLTGFVYAGLFFRDLLLARILGLGGELDVVQLASFYSLSAAGLLAVPFGPVLINMFMDVRENSGEAALAAWISAMSALMLVLFSVVALLIGGGLVLGPVVTGLGSSHAVVFYDVLPMLLVVLALSGSVVLGNAVLSATGRADLATAAQLAVPALSILFIALFSSEWGAPAVAFGLLAGQVANYVLVRLALSGVGYSFVPRFGQTYWRRWLGQYLPLVAASALTVVGIPVGIYLASELPEGSVGAFSLGAKVIQFATGLVTAGLIAVVLPHFAKLSATQRLGDLKKSVAFFIVFGSVISVPVALLISAQADHLASLLFGGGRITSDAVVQLGSVIRYSSLQFPFFVVMAVLVKFTVASRSAAWVFVSALLGQCVNFLIGGFLVKHFGVAGVAMAMTSGVLVSSLSILSWAWLKGHVSMALFALIGMIWLLFLTLSVCLHFGNTLGALACAFAFLLIVSSQFRLRLQLLAKLTG